MIVVDASVTTDALTNSGVRGANARAAIVRDPQLLVPEHWTVEVFSAIRGLAAGKKISDSDAATALVRLGRMKVETAPTVALLPTMWRLRENVSGYDAPYVALAAERELTLVTADEPLARAAVRHCRVELLRTA